MWAPDVPRAFGHPVGVANVSGRGPLRGATLRQRIGELDLRNTPLATRMRIVKNGGCWQPVPGDTCTYSFYEHGRPTQYVLETAPEPAQDGIVVILRDVLGLLWLIAAAALLLVRPTHATWAFFALSLFGFTPNNVFTEVGPAWWQVTMTAFDMAWESAIPFIAPIFALYLLQPERLPGWRRFALWTSYALVAGVAAFQVAGTVGVAAGSMTALKVVSPYSPIQSWLNDLPVVLAPLLLLATYLDSARDVRQRIRWVLVGFTVGGAAIIANMWAVQLSYFAYSLCFAAYVFCVTASTAYAVLRHRIIDVNVVLGRTLVYTLLSGIVVGLLALVDLFFSRTLSQSRDGLIADVALALVVGFFLNTMHNRLDRLVDGVVFRRRHIAENHVALVAQSLRHATQPGAVSAMLVDEPVRAFDLQFGALARPIANDTLEIVQATQSGLVGARLDGADALCAYVSSKRRALPVRNHFWQPKALTDVGFEAAIAVPIFSRDSLDAVAFFGAHRNGTELDGDEIALIERVADAAGVAYDWLRVKELEREIAALRLQPTSAS